ncbi:DUF3046 domain-containing protein [Agromyces sp. MMS24-K17]|uniref:DUF3046 domain-containing protein n=1 Tax=Agromyces sp. MMS24-K17 TaxID=3372850 RepID=UPI0037549F70
MKLSEFRLAVDDEFGEAYGAVVLRDVVLEVLGGRTATEALSAGVAPREVWLALCVAMDVPTARRHGPTRRERGPRA